MANPIGAPAVDLLDLFLHLSPDGSCDLGSSPVLLNAEGTMVQHRIWGALALVRGSKVTF